MLLRGGQAEYRGVAVRSRVDVQGVSRCLPAAEHPIRRQLPDPNTLPEDRRRWRRRQDEVQGLARGGPRQGGLRTAWRHRRRRLRHGALRSVT